MANNIKLKMQFLGIYQYFELGTQVDSLFVKTTKKSRGKLFEISF